MTNWGLLQVLWVSQLRGFNLFHILTDLRRVFLYTLAQTALIVVIPVGLLAS